MPPRAVGDASCILHVAPDGIVVDHGRNVAIYPVPTGLVVRVGDRIAIDRNGQLRLPLPGQGKDVGIG